jgi:hypothetical protein
MQPINGTEQIRKNPDPVQGRATETRDRECPPLPPIVKVVEKKVVSARVNAILVF